MVRISLKHKFIFFRIPKTASTSISDVLSSFEDKTLNFVLKRELEDNLAVLNLNSSSHINQILLKPVLDKLKIAVTPNFFEFVFVRHPYARIASMYNSMKVQHNSEILSPHYTIDDIIDWCEERTENYDNHKGKMIYNSQLNWINYPLSHKVHFFKLEELDASWNIIKEKLNLDLPNIPTLNTSPTKSSISDLTKPQQDRVYKIWQKEFEFLEYDR